MNVVKPVRAAVAYISPLVQYSSLIITRDTRSRFIVCLRTLCLRHCSLRNVILVIRALSGPQSGSASSHENDRKCGSSCVIDSWCSSIRNGACTLFLAAGLLRLADVHSYWVDLHGGTLTWPLPITTPSKVLFKTEFIVTRGICQQFKFVKTRNSIYIDIRFNVSNV